MNTPLRAVIQGILLFLAPCSVQCFAEETNIAVGEWSAPVNDLSGRLRITEGRTLGFSGPIPLTIVYLDLKYVGVRALLHLYFDPRQGLKYQLKDSKGTLADPSLSSGNGRFPIDCWLTLPRGSTTQLRVSWFGHGMRKEEGLMIPVYSILTLPIADTNVYNLYATFTSNGSTNAPPAEAEHLNTWIGKIDLPPLTVSSKRE